jgi:hypothetical protein
MNAKGTILRAACLGALILAHAGTHGLAADSTSRSSSSSSSGVNISTANGETVVTANGQEVYRGPTRGAVSSVSRSENGVEYSAILDGDRVLWESSPGAAGKLPSNGSGGGAGGGGAAAGIDADAFMAEHQANFERMVREAQQQQLGGAPGGFRSSGSQSGSSRSGGQSMSGGRTWSSSGGSAQAGGSSSSSAGGSSRGFSSAGGRGSGSSSGGGSANGNGFSSGDGSAAGFGDGTGNRQFSGNGNARPNTGPAIQPGNPGLAPRGTETRPATSPSPKPISPTTRKPSTATPASEEASVTFKVVEGSSVVVFRGREYPVGPTYERLTGKSWSSDGKEYAIARDGDRVIWENIPGAARKLSEVE